MMDPMAHRDQMQAAAAAEMRDSCRVMATVAAALRDELETAGFTTDHAQTLVEIWVDRTIEHWTHRDCDL